MELHAQLVHAEAGCRVVAVSARLGEIGLGTALGEGATAEEAEDRARQRLLQQLGRRSGPLSPGGAADPQALTTSPAGRGHQGVPAPLVSAPLVPAPLVPVRSVPTASPRVIPSRLSGGATFSDRPAGLMERSGARTASPSPGSAAAAVPAAAPVRSASAATAAAGAGVASGPGLVRHSVAAQPMTGDPGADPPFGSTVDSHGDFRRGIAADLTIGTAEDLTIGFGEDLTVGFGDASGEARPDGRSEALAAVHPPGLNGDGGPAPASAGGSESRPGAPPEALGSDAAGLDPGSQPPGGVAAAAGEPPLDSDPGEEPPADPEDWSSELAAVELQLRRLGWNREQEALYLQRAFNHPSRSRLTRYSDLLAYLHALEALPPGADPSMAAVPLRRSELLAQGDALLAGLGWGPEQGRSFLEQQLQRSHRRQLSDAQLLAFNMLLESELLGLSAGPLGEAVAIEAIPQESASPVLGSATTGSAAPDSQAPEMEPTAEAPAV